MTAIQAPERKQNTGPGIVSWIATIAACCYFAWIGFSLYRLTAASVNLFANNAVELRQGTLFLVANYRWYYPMLFGCAAALVLAKQLFVPSKWPNIALTVTIAFVVALAGNQILSSLYQPVFDLLEKINK
ncbi:MAG: hypothetical protein ACM3SW_04970 [Actinomycetota bacterium]